MAKSDLTLSGFKKRIQSKDIECGIVWPLKQVIKDQFESLYPKSILQELELINKPINYYDWFAELYGQNIKHNVYIKNPLLSLTKKK